MNTFAVRHFTVLLQYFEFCPVESEENFFKENYFGKLAKLMRENEEAILRQRDKVK